MNNQTLTRKELYDLVWSSPFSTLAKKYLISDNDLRKICLKMDIPLPKSGHWGKIQFNKPVEIIKLSKDYSGENEIILTIREEGDDGAKVSSPLSALQTKLETNFVDSLIVPDRLTNPDKYTIAAKESLTKKEIYLHNGVVHTGRGELDIRVAQANVGRALRFMDTFIKVIRIRGHQIIIDDNNTYVVIEEEKIKITCREKLRRIVIKDTWERTEYVPTGVLSFKVEMLFNDTEWNDGKLPIEKQLSKIIAKLEIKGKEIREQRMVWRKEREIQEEKRRVELALEKRKEKELADFNDLLIEAKQWQEAELLRSYLNDTEAKAKRNNNNSEVLKNWLLWARKKADWYDPQISLSDELLD